jgi:bifunctional non-homologous end joining protein LigD
MQAIMDIIASSAAGLSPASIGLRFIAPQMPTLVSEPPTGAGWLHEIKHDGYRSLLMVDDHRARAFSRNGHDWSEQYAPICIAATGLPCRSALIDGEVIVQDEVGRADFGALRSVIRFAPERLVFVAFDLLHLDGRDLRRSPLVERRAALRDLFADTGPPFLFSEHHAGDGAALFAAAEQLGLEGIVSKRANSRYRSGPSKAWLKTKCMTESEFILVGMERNEGGPPFALLAREDQNGLTYCGSAFVTLPHPARDEFWSRAEALKMDRPVLPELRKGRRKARFVRPELRVRAKHLRGGDMLRHATLAAVLA